jgi:hypothetical protein
MHAGWAQDRVSPLVKARLFVVRRDWYKSPRWKLNKPSSGANPYTKASCQGKTPAFPESQGQVRQTSGDHAVKRTKTTSGDLIYCGKIYQATVLVSNEGASLTLDRGPGFNMNIFYLGMVEKLVANHIVDMVFKCSLKYERLIKFRFKFRMKGTRKCDQFEMFNEFVMMKNSRSERKGRNNTWRLVLNYHCNTPCSCHR